MANWECPKRNAFNNGSQNDKLADEMLQQIKIQNFKGVKSGKVADLRNVNLFVGKNDSGKSTIFEATYHGLH